jgi:hypothetical protein
MGPRAKISDIMFASPRTVPYSATVALGNTSMAEHGSPKLGQVRHVLMAEQVVSTLGQNPSLDSEEHARYCWQVS